MSDFKGRNQAGFSLIEVLVAALIMGIGLYGIVLMQTKSVQYSREAYLFSQASFLAQDMVERMRNNTGVASSYIVSTSANPTSSVDCMAAECDEAALAAWDKANWKTTLAKALPGGNGSVLQVSADNQFTIHVQFTSSIELDSSGTQTTQMVIITTQI